MVVDVLREAPVFQGMSEAALKQIAAICEERRFRAGGVVFTENAPAGTCYIVAHGEVATRFMRPVGGPVTVHIIGRGGVFGWQSLLGGQRYLASAVCETDATVLAADAADLQRLVERDKRVAFRFMSSLARLIGFRLKCMKARLLDEMSNVS